MNPPRYLALMAALLLAFALAACAEEEAPAVGEVTTATVEGGTPALQATASPSPAPPEGTSTATEPPGATATDETVASTFFIPTHELPVVRFTTDEGDEVELPVEVPPESEYGVGLSGRRELEGRGMVFYYAGESGGPGFWMRNTHIDLDIAFVDGEGEVIFVTTMEAETTDVHHPGRAYLAGIEAPAGWYAEHGIAVGDRAEFLFDPEALPGGGLSRHGRPAGD